MENNHDVILILTDLEPDDILALYLLKKYIQNDTIIYVITGEGNLIKCNMCESILNIIGYKNYIVFDGNKSEKEYPKDIIDTYIYDKEQKYTFYLDVSSIKGLIENFNNPLIIGLKPFTEIIKYISYISLKKSTFIVYGSFNFRCMLKDYNNETLANFINNSFKRVIIYESYYATGEKNSMNTYKMEKVNNKFFNKLLKTVELWNIFILKDCIKSSKAYLDIMMKSLVGIGGIGVYNNLDIILDKILNRNLKVVKTIIENKNKQMVLADQALIETVFNKKVTNKIGKVIKGNIYFDDKGYTKIKEDKLGKVEIICDVDYDTLVGEIEKKY